jgi:hypothetical protein
VAGVFANDSHDTSAADHFALVANFLDARSNLHGSLVAVGDAPATRVIGAYFDSDSIAGQDADVKLPHPSTDRRKDDEAIVTLYAEHSVGQRFLHGAIEFQLVAFGLLSLATLSHVYD